MDDVGAGVDSGDDHGVVGRGPVAIAVRVVPDGFGVERGDDLVAAGQVLFQCPHAVAGREVGFDAVLLQQQDHVLGRGAVKVVDVAAMGFAFGEHPA
ncbi:MAG TPA: hypothetical protein VKI00_04195 [Mycobacterium sp.]|uniref:hypothetical protein n=1 Tax=Mycobacterium sp. TaxID=1785 RepID=UPI002C9AEFF2|nr:hypothetical protein [Mycobacterium sp.]HME74865.1 hypothetical protein [Mycobacterium sp.]